MGGVRRNIEEKRIANRTDFHAYNVKEIILQQNRRDGYVRLDTYVRLLAIEQQYGLNEIGWNLYKKMQKARLKESDEQVEERVRVFKELIKSWEDKGYDEDSRITLFENLKLEDGGHRMALSLYHGQDRINCRVLPKTFETNYGIEWFIENDFTAEEIKCILDKADEVIGKNKIYMSCLLWSPVEKYFDEITEKIKLLYKVVSCEDLVFSQEETYPRFVRTVYKSDDVADWKVEKKLEHMSQPGEKAVRYIVVEVNNPVYRRKGMNGNPILTQMESLKKVIRNCYAGKIDNYFHDIVMHTSDNLDQMEYIDRLVHPTFSVADYLEEIKKFDYCLLKTDTGYMTKDFPKTFPFAKDTDMLTLREHFDELVGITKEFFTKRCKGFYDDLIVRESEGRCKVRIELKGNVIYEVDIICAIEGIDDGYCRSIVENRRKYASYWIPAIEDEVCIRANEYIAHPNKQRHLDYVKRHIASMNEDKIVKYVENGKDFLDSLGGGHGLVYSLQNGTGSSRKVGQKKKTD